MKKILKWPIKIIFTTENLTVVDIFGEEIELADESAAWTGKEIYIHLPSLQSFWDKIGAIIHEITEQFLEVKLKLPHRISHFIANVIEKYFTFFQSKVYF